jgi:hypothetical protein
MARKRRGRGEGSISQRTDGLGEAKVSLSATSDCTSSLWWATRSCAR